MKKSRSYHALVLVVKLGLALLVVWTLVRLGILDLGAFRLAIGMPWVLAVVAGLALLTYFLSAYRWNLLLTCQGVGLPLRAAASVTFLGLFVNSFLPGGGIGGEAVRATYLVKVGKTAKTTALLSVFVDRMLGLYAILLIAFLLMFANPDSIREGSLLRYLAAAVAGLCLGSPIAVLILYRVSRTNRRLRNFMNERDLGGVAGALQKLLGALRLYHRAPGTILGGLLLSIMAHSIAMACIMYIGHGLRLGTLAPLELGLAAPWAWLANLLPFTPGGLGAGEAAFDRICHFLERVPTTTAYGTIFLIHRVASLVATLPGFFIYLIWHERNRDLFDDRDRSE